eukprot:scaffold4801_cov69-Phaeocystis_antarctica.AAC.4
MRKASERGRAKRRSVGADRRPFRRREERPRERQGGHRQAGTQEGGACEGGAYEGHDGDGERGGGANDELADPGVEVDERGGEQPAQVQGAGPRERRERRGRNRCFRGGREQPSLRVKEAEGAGAEQQRGQPQQLERPRAEGDAPEGLRTVGGEPRGIRGADGALDGGASNGVSAACAQDDCEAHELAHVDEAPDGEGEAGGREERRPR